MIIDLNWLRTIKWGYLPPWPAHRTIRDIRTGICCIARMSFVWAAEQFSYYVAHLVFQFERHILFLVWRTVDRSTPTLVEWIYFWRERESEGGREKFIIEIRQVFSFGNQWVTIAAKKKEHYNKIPTHAPHTTSLRAFVHVSHCNIACIYARRTDSQTDGAFFQWWMNDH